MASFWKRVYSGNAERRTQGGKGGFGVSISSKNIIGGDSSLNPAWGSLSICPLMVLRLVTDCRGVCQAFSL